MRTRNSIFDYWHVDTLGRWYNNGNISTQNLSSEELELQQFYRGLLTICNKEKAISEGSFFDLMYANYDQWDFDSNRQYAFLRTNNEELILIVANFDSQPKQISIQIPKHAFDCLSITPLEQVKASDLLTNQVETIAFNDYQPVKTLVPAWGGKLLKITFK